MYVLLILDSLALVPVGGEHFNANQRRGILHALPESEHLVKPSVSSAPLQSQNANAERLKLAVNLI